MYLASVPMFGPAGGPVGAQKPCRILRDGAAAFSAAIAPNPDAALT
jgi:hypothetical protein